MSRRWFWISLPHFGWSSETLKCEKSSQSELCFFFPLCLCSERMLNPVMPAHCYRPVSFFHSNLSYQEFQTCSYYLWRGVNFYLTYLSRILEAFLLLLSFLNSCLINTCILIYGSLFTLLYYVKKNFFWLLLLSSLIFKNKICEVEKNHCSSTLSVFLAGLTCSSFLFLHW